jgi:hypothetical protein
MIAYAVGSGSVGGTVVVESCIATLRDLAIFLAWVPLCENDKGPRHNQRAVATNERRKGDKRQRAGGLETLFRGIKTGYVAENKGRVSGKAKQRPDMCMKTKRMTVQSRYVSENKSG